jgi:hypothetical protein
VFPVVCSLVANLVIGFSYHPHLISTQRLSFFIPARRYMHFVRYTDTSLAKEGMTSGDAVPQGARKSKVFTRNVIDAATRSRDAAERNVDTENEREHTTLQARCRKGLSGRKRVTRRTRRFCFTEEKEVCEEWKQMQRASFRCSPARPGVCFT